MKKGCLLVVGCGLEGKEHIWPKAHQRFCYAACGSKAQCNAIFQYYKIYSNIRRTCKDGTILGGQWQIGPILQGPLGARGGMNERSWAPVFLLRPILSTHLEDESRRRSAFDHDDGGWRRLATAACSGARSGDAAVLQSQSHVTTQCCRDQAAGIPSLSRYRGGFCLMDFCNFQEFCSADISFSQSNPFQTQLHIVNDYIDNRHWWLKIWTWLNTKG